MPRRSDFGIACCLRPSDAGSALGSPHFRGHICVHCRYSPVTRNLPTGVLVDGLQDFGILVSRHPAIQTTGLLTFALAGLSPAEHTSLYWSQHPDLSLSTHPARAIARRLPPSVDKGLLSANRLAQINGDDLPPSLHDHYSRFFTSTRQSAPLRRIGTFGLAVRAACAFSLGIAGQVLTFHTGAWSSFAPPTRRMPLGRYQDILRADPGGWVSPRFRHRLISFRRFRSGSLALASLDHACRDHVPTFPRRSPPQLLTAAARGGLGSAT